MQNYIEAKTSLTHNIQSYVWTAFQVVVGSILLALCAQIKVPLYPVPATLQTLGVFMLGTFQGSKKASASVLLYLLFISLGLPIMASGTCQPLWFTLPTAGYLVGFSIASYVIGSVIERYPSLSIVKLGVTFFCGQCIIYILGIASLMRFLSFETSLAVGLIPFLAVDSLKIIIATACSATWLRWKRT